MSGHRAVFERVVAAIFVSICVAAPSAKSQTTTCRYTGSRFNFCGYGCPGSLQPENAPADWAEDYIIATITFDAPLAPNLTFSNDVLSLLRGWTLQDAKGYFAYSSAAGDVLRGLPEEGFPIPLQISTDGNGNIVDYLMGTSRVPGTVGTEVGIINPPIFCAECGNVSIASTASVNIGNDDIEWDVGTINPGQWKRLQPTTYQYTGSPFKVCTFGPCPANFTSDYIIATITLDAPLAPNLVQAEFDAVSALTAWTMRDALAISRGLRPPLPAT